MIPIIWYRVIIIFDNFRDIYISYFFLLNLYIILTNLNVFFIFRFNILRVAEVSIGLPLLTIIVRNHGNDYLKIMILFWGGRPNVLILKIKNKILLFS